MKLEAGDISLENEPRGNPENIIDNKIAQYIAGNNIQRSERDI